MIADKFRLLLPWNILRRISTIEGNYNTMSEIINELEKASDANTAAVAQIAIDFQALAERAAQAHSDGDEEILSEVLTEMQQSTAALVALHPVAPQTDPAAELAGTTEG